jgi:hypothetical protein
VARVAAAARPGLQTLAVGDLGQLVRAIMLWMESFGETVPDLDAIDSVPVVATSGVRGPEMDFALEMDLGALLALVSALEEMDATTDAETDE